jgi:hypothetical protein
MDEPRTFIFEWCCQRCGPRPPHPAAGPAIRPQPGRVSPGVTRRPPRAPAQTGAALPVTVPGERAARTGQIVGVVVVTVAAYERLDRHPEEACGLPRVGTCLHQPSRRRACGVTSGPRPAFFTSAGLSLVSFVPHNWPRRRSEVQETWSEWRDLNLRPPRPERGALPATLHFACGLSAARCGPTTSD